MLFLEKPADACQRGDRKATNSQRNRERGERKAAKCQGSKATCCINDGENISSKRRSEDDVPYETNPIVQAFVDGIINGPPKSSVIQKEDDFHSSTIADNDVFQPFGNADEERVLPISKYDKPPSREHKLPSPTTSVVDYIIDGLQKSTNSEVDSDDSLTVADKNVRKRKLPSPTPSVIEGVLQGFQKKLNNDDNGDDDSSYMSIDIDDDSRQSFNDDDSVTSEGTDSSFETEVDSDENFNPKEKPSKGDISSEDGEVN